MVVLPSGTAITPQIVHFASELSNAQNVVFISTEVAPWSKTGGLGDVVRIYPASRPRLPGLP